MEQSNPRDLAIQGLKRMKGDDLHRARAAFRNYTPEQMQKEYGQSGDTPAQILADYEAYERKIDEAILWVTSRN
jgi:hypothetical protein